MEINEMELIVEDCRSHPSCPHGPCLLFERYSSNGTKTGRKFFACSACRDRKDCSFFQWADDEMSEQSKKYWQQLIQQMTPPFSHEEFFKRLKKFKQLPDDKKLYCRTCSLLILDDVQYHISHSIKNISVDHLIQPTFLFETLENKKVEAQFFFSDETVEFLMSLLKEMGYNKFLLIGTPKLAEYLSRVPNDKTSFFFMDIDHRYMQFYSPEQFCRYNMFNNFFFSEKNSKKQLKQFLFENDNQKIVLILDPPFGGLIDAISFSLKKINSMWQKVNSKQCETISTIWFFPYFNEERIIKNLPNMKMIDYKVSYSNHKKFHSRANSKSSPVRIFTNIKASDFILPVEEGYRFCAECQRFVSSENKHCSDCNACTTKHGKTYHHCKICKKCVKFSYSHCKSCNMCTPVSSNDSSSCKNCKCLPMHSEEKSFEKCFKCSGIGHRKRSCPEGLWRHMKTKKKKQFGSFV